MDLNVGTITDFASVKPEGRHTRVFVFTNKTDYVWTDVWVTTGPQAFFGPLGDPFGYRGRPPKMTFIGITTPGPISFGSSPNDDDYASDLQSPVGINEEITIRLDFDEGFEAPEWLQITFSYTDPVSAMTGIPVPGSTVVGTALPTADENIIIDLMKLGGGRIPIPGVPFSRAEAPSPAPGDLLAFVGSEMQLIKTRVTALETRLNVLSTPAPSEVTPPARPGRRRGSTSR